MGKGGEVSGWLNDKLLDLQRESGRRWTVTEFSKYLDCPQPQVSRWLMGKATPGSIYIDKIAAKLGYEIYDVMGLLRPDPDLRYIAANWERSSAKLRRAVRSLFERGLGKDD